jgi:hypothetical protein
MTRTTIPQANLPNSIEEVVDRVHPGEATVVERSGHDRVVLLDPLDFRLLLALAQCAMGDKDRVQEPEDPDVRALRAYLAAEITLGKTAECASIWGPLPWKKHDGKSRLR